jgi:hypothetical protein
MRSIENEVSDYLEHCTYTMLAEIVNHSIHSITNDFNYNVEYYDDFSQEFDKQAKQQLAAINKINEICYYSPDFDTAYDAIKLISEYEDDYSDESAGILQYMSGGYRFFVNIEKERIDGNTFQQEESA